MSAARADDPEPFVGERLLFHLAPLNPAEASRAAALQLLKDEAFPWDLVSALATAQRVAPLLAYNLERDTRLSALVPPAAAQALHATRIAATLRHALYTREVGPVLDALSRDGIVIALMKGAALAATVYPPGTRGLNDFDILVDQRDYHAVVAAFTAGGFTKVFRRGRTEAETLAAYHQVSLMKNTAATVLTVDLHWLMYPADRAFCRIGTESLMRRARSVAFGSSSPRALSPEDLLVHYGSQLVNDGLRWDFLRLCDMHALASNPLDWDLLVDIARRAGAAASAHLACSFAVMLGADVPPFVFRRLRAASLGCHLPATYLASPRHALLKEALPGAMRPLLIALMHTGVYARSNYLWSFATQWWRQSCANRGALRSSLAAARGGGEVAVRAVGLIARGGNAPTVT